MTVSTESHIDARMYTKHGAKKNQGKWALVNNRPALTFTEGQDEAEKVVGYTTIDEMMSMAYSKDLPQYELDF